MTDGNTDVRRIIAEARRKSYRHRVFVAGYGAALLDCQAGASLDTMSKEEFDARVREAFRDYEEERPMTDENDTTAAAKSGVECPDCGHETLEVTGRRDAWQRGPIDDRVTVVGPWTETVECVRCGWGMRFGREESR